MSHTPFTPASTARTDPHSPGRRGNRRAVAVHSAAARRRLAPSDTLRRRAPELVAALVPVWVSESPAELEAVWRFRYDVYATEFGRNIGSPDHARRQISSALDAEPGTMVVYTTDAADAVSGTARLSRWEPGAIGPHAEETYGIGSLGWAQEAAVCTIESLMVARDARGGSTLVSICIALAEHAIATGCEAVLMSCWPGLVPMYGSLGFTPYAGPVWASPDGVLAPMMISKARLRGLRGDGSLAAMMGEFHQEDLGDGGLRSADAIADIDAAVDTPLDTDPARVRAALDHAVAAAPPEAPLAALDERTIGALAGQTYLLRIPAGTRLTARGVKERELFAIVSGELAVTGGEGELTLRGTGEVVGEETFLGVSERRCATATALSAVEVIVIRPAVLRRLRAVDPDTAAALVETLSRGRTCDDTGGATK